MVAGVLWVINVETVFTIVRAVSADNGIPCARSQGGGRASGIIAAVTVGKLVNVISTLTTIAVRRHATMSPNYCCGYQCRINVKTF